MKKYIKTIEDLEALKNTDTIICNEDSDRYYKFVNGVLCMFLHYKDELMSYNCHFDFAYNWYVELEQPIQEVTEKDIGKLCKFWHSTDNVYVFDFLKSVYIGSQYPYKTEHNNAYMHCRRLTEEEIKEIV